MISKNAKKRGLTSHNKDVYCALFPQSLRFEKLRSFGKSLASWLALDYSNKAVAMEGKELV